MVYNRFRFLGYARNDRENPLLGMTGGEISCYGAMGARVGAGFRPFAPTNCHFSFGKASEDGGVAPFSP